MLFSQIDCRSPEKSRYRNVQNKKQVDNVLRLCCRQVMKATADGQQLMLANQQPIHKAQMVVKVAGISQSKSPKGIDIIDLYVKDDTGEMIVSCYRNQWPNDVLALLLANTGIQYPNQLIGKYIHVCVSPRPNPTNKFRPFRYIASSARPVNDFNEVSLHRLGVIRDYCGVVHGEL